MKMKVYLLGLAVASCLSCYVSAPVSPPMTPMQKAAFAGCVGGLPAGTQSKAFQGNFNYPKTSPVFNLDQYPWLKVDVDFVNDPPRAWQDTKWPEYTRLLLEYVKQQQTSQLDGQSGWNYYPNPNLTWYTAPWLATDPATGRECLHGMSNERSLHLSDLLGWLNLDASEAASNEKFETWAFTAYNPPGGYTLGQIWNKDGVPQTVTGKDGFSTLIKGLPFPKGALTVKLLFTTASDQTVPFLKGSPQWTIDAHQPGSNCKRSPQPAHLLQMDVAVVDERAPTNWVFTTFVYDGSYQAGDTIWQHMVSLGVQFGNDPESFPAVPMSQSKPVRQSILNDTVSIYEHQGCYKRLAGPADSPQSSCLSCHGAAYTPPVGVVHTSDNLPPAFGFEGVCTEYSQMNADYFSNLDYPKPYPSGGKSVGYTNDMPLDTSMQTQIGLGQYALFVTQGGPKACKEDVQ